MYWRLGHSPEAQEGAAQAAKLGRWPLIRLTQWTNPTLTQAEPGKIAIRASNIGYGPARQLCLNLGGSLLMPVDCRILTPLGADSHFDITHQIVPSKATNTLRLQAEYVELAGRQPPFLANFEATIEARPPRGKIKVGDSLGGKLRIVNPRNEPADTGIGDRVWTEAEIVLDGS